MFEGVLQKMKTEFSAPVQYYLILGADFLHVNTFLQKKISIQHIGYQCISCGEEKEIFRQGFCKKCFFESPLVGDWIMKPELSKAHLGIEDRDLAYEKQAQLQPHIVYLANSSNVKVGVTRKSQIPTRWIDQGAHEALPLVEVPNRYLAGITEVAFKNYISDKTNWRKMLTNDIQLVDLQHIKQLLKPHLPSLVASYFLENEPNIYINFPVLVYPKKISSLNLQKTPFYQGTLQGIKGQYLIFADGTVLNIRAYEGFKVKMEII
ncbi:hypothetical protein RCZ15_15780 [Capnocytophaga catalasegens]|uniref:DUF2797 domain-containing protein n=2 Tax=Capnocytophaga catalasegens TaxID=1004260 RepID=A0AAV5AYR8_9FLAO|nr:hypothetical protein RCZ03_07570 [Capnocytophaga catalasegens]GJM50605.1 hypothetical protein RCZ15_15780 [Capnocytophaga catalasegens]GJM53564.1 hypothetical protein RCZ16_18800 [Capnocytophaga catalasegens]